MPTYEGHCHCGAVTFSVTTDTEIKAGVRCNCSLCRRKAAVMVLVDQVQFTLTGGGDLQLVHNRDGVTEQLALARYDDDTLYLKVTADYLSLGFFYSADGTNWKILADGIDASVLAPERIGGFNYTGAYIGLYGTTNGVGEGRATYDFMEYHPTTTDANNWFYRRPSE